MKRSTKTAPSSSHSHLPKVKEVPFSKWYKHMASTGVGPDLVEQFAKLRPILSDPAHHDATFGILVSLGLPKAHWVKPPWNYNIEKERFKAAFTVDKANPDSHMDDQPKYTSFVMKLLHLDKKYAKVQELSDNTLVDSLKFVLSFCSTVKQADLQTMRLLLVCRDQVRRLESLLRRGDKVIDKEDDNRLSALWTLKDATFHLVDKMVELDKVSSKHLANIMLKCSLLPRYKDHTREEIRFDTEILEKMKKMGQRIEILGNIVAAEKDPEKKTKFEDDLKKEKAEFETFTGKDETCKEFSFMALGTLQLMNRTYRNEGLSHDMLQKIVATLKTYNRQVSEYNIEWLTMSSRRRRSR
ncbi:uncharacterized protein LOC110857763 [Folsomia candida]|uniref:uncharacterized protein LOC110857763 n=1 Tax=Folsomia candida TaxID=158441 RepID=UPI000B9056A6|nr:uncharacterized protein LOC110857763 [Folsomia candida]